jgi:peptide/nickel transport system permease protein
MNRRQRTLGVIAFSILFLGAVVLLGVALGDAGLSTNLPVRHTPPSWAHPFGTDWLGRDMLTRTIHGLILSLSVGLGASLISAVIGLTVGIVAGTAGGKIDAVLTWIIDLFMSLPHLVLLILIAFAVGGGVKGVVIAVAVTHWTGLARIIRAEMLQLKNAEYAVLSLRLGKPLWWIAYHHHLPHLVPQFVVGLLLLFPHAILHEAAISFIGIGLSPHQPAIGIILAESMRHLSTGYWWLAVLPGFMLLLVVLAFDALGQSVLALTNPRSAQE